MTQTQQSDLNRRFGPMALVTGASDGIGRAFAEALAAKGFDLTLVARRETVLQAVARDLQARFSVKVRVLAADLSGPGSVAQVLDKTAQDPIHLLVAAAGFGSIGPFEALDPAVEANMVDLNCRSVVELAQGIGARMKAAGRGGIVFLGSLVGFQGAPYSATYAATKGFVQSFAEGLAAEWRPYGISVLSVAPGPIASGFAARSGMRMGKTQTPDVVARAALRALGRQMTVRPGALFKVLGWSMAMLPRPGRVALMGQIMNGMRPDKAAARKP